MLDSHKYKEYCVFLQCKRPKECLSPISYCSTRVPIRSAFSCPATSSGTSIPTSTSTSPSLPWKSAASSSPRFPSGTLFLLWSIPSVFPENNAVLRRPLDIKHLLPRDCGVRVYYRKPPPLRSGPSHRKRRAPPAYVAEGGHRCPIVHPHS